MKIKNLLITCCLSLLVLGSFFGINKVINNVNASGDEITYEKAQYISVSDLKSGGNFVGDKINNKDTQYFYDKSNAPTNNSVVFIAKIDYKEQETVQFYLISSGEDNWSQTAFVQMTSNKVAYGVTNPDGSLLELRSVSYNELAKGSSHVVEYGRIAILNNGSFSGLYKTYFKLDGNELFSIDQAYTASIALGGLLHIAGSSTGSVDIINNYSNENGLIISISDLKSGGSLVGDTLMMPKHLDYSYDNSSHTANNSVIFKFYMLVKTPAEHQFHLSTDANKWDTASSFILKSTSCHLGRSSIGNSNVSWSDNNSFSETTGTIYQIEYGRLANLLDGNFVGTYYTYLKINNNLMLEGNYAIDTEITSGNHLFITSNGEGGDYLFDINYDFTDRFEDADVVSISDLNKGQFKIGNTLVLNQHQTLNYDANTPHKSVIFKFIYDRTNTNAGCQIHFYDGWISDFDEDKVQSGMVWLQNDGSKGDIFRIAYKNVSKETAYESSSYYKDAIYDIEVGKLYINGGANIGKYYVYLKLNGTKILEHTFDIMPNDNHIFLSGNNGDHFYDINYIPNVEIDSKLYTYKWDIDKSGIEFDASIEKKFIDLRNANDVGFILIPKNDLEEELDVNTDGAIRVSAKLINDGAKYVIKASIAALDIHNIARDYVAKVYVNIPNAKGNGNIFSYSNEYISSFYDELSDLSGLPEDYVNAFMAIKNKVLVSTLDPDNCIITGASKTGDFSTDSITLTGSNPFYTAYIFNGKPVINNEIVKIGYRSYKVSLGNNSLTLTKEDNKLMFGGSEHFVEINHGHDDLMTSVMLAPMINELGLKTIRLDCSLSDVFDVLENDELRIDIEGLANLRYVVKTLKEESGVEDFLGVLWTIQPYGGYSPSQAPWASNTAPDPNSQASEYLRWLKINGKAAMMLAKLVPEIHNFETWNEAEIQNETGPLVKQGGGYYTVAEKAKILTDLMYYYNKGIKEANPDNILTTPSICCATTASSPFDCTSPEFLRALYSAISDDIPVTGYELDKNPNNYFQVINIHPYLGYGTTQSNWTTFVAKFYTEAINNNDSGTEIWVTEFGFAQNRTDNVTTKMTSVINQAMNIDYLTKFYFYKVHDYQKASEGGKLTGGEANDEWGLYDYYGNIKSIGTMVKNLINPS